MVRLRQTKHTGYVAYDKSPRFFREPNVKFELALVIALPVEQSMFQKIGKYNYFHCLIENNKKMFSSREMFKKVLLKEILIDAVM